MHIFPFFFIFKERMFFFSQINMLLETNPSLGKYISPLHGVLRWENRASARPGARVPG
jgi:hypothetical protein